MTGSLGLKLEVQLLSAGGLTWSCFWWFPLKMLGLYPILSIVFLLKRVGVFLCLLLEAGVRTPQYEAIVPRSLDERKLWTVNGVLNHEHKCLKGIIACKHCRVKSIDGAIRIHLWLILCIVRCSGRYFWWCSWQVEATARIINDEYLCPLLTFIERL